MQSDKIRNKCYFRKKIVQKVTKKNRKIVKKFIFSINGYISKISNLLFADKGLSTKFIFLTEL